MQSERTASTWKGRAGADVWERWGGEEDGHVGDGHAVSPTGKNHTVMESSEGRGRRHRGMDGTSVRPGKGRLARDNRRHRR